MRIITINLPQSTIDALDEMCGEGGNRSYLSRSEAIRVGVRDFLIGIRKEIEELKNSESFILEKEEDDGFLRVDGKKYQIIRNREGKYEKKNTSQL